MLTTNWFCDGGDCNIIENDSILQKNDSYYSNNDDSYDNYIFSSHKKAGRKKKTNLSQLQTSLFGDFNLLDSINEDFLFFFDIL